MDDNNILTKKLAAEEGRGSGFHPIEFARETRREIAKVTWPTRKETLVTTAMIVAMALIVGLFFFGVDYVLGIAGWPLAGHAGIIREKGN